ncbi:accessory Sec system protein Asp3 [Enterococcus alishanensis]
MSNVFLIRWGHDFKDINPSGATVRFLPDGKYEYSSKYMSISAVLKTWYSRFIYQTRRKSPLLPLLIQEKAYDISIVGTFDPDKDIQLTIVFFDNENEIIDEIYFKKLQGHFVYPADAISYEVRIQNKSHQSFIFNYLMIAEADINEHFILDIKDNLHVVSFLNQESTKKNEITILNSGKNTLTFPVKTDEPKNYFFILLDEDSQALDEVSYAYNLITNNSLEAEAEFSIFRGNQYQKVAQKFPYLPQLFQALLPDVASEYWFVEAETETEKLIQKLQINEYASEILANDRVGGNER